jgi:hypothetical protein
MSPAGMEPLGSERHGQSPQGRSAGALRSIEPSCRPTTKLPTIWHIAECPRRESNPHLRFRKPPFYPLNYEDSLFTRCYVNSITKYANVLPKVLLRPLQFSNVRPRILAYAKQPSIAEKNQRSIA